MKALSSLAFAVVILITTSTMTFSQSPLFTNVDLTVRLNAYGDQYSQYVSGGSGFYTVQYLADSKTPTIYRETVFPQTNSAINFCYYSGDTPFGASRKNGRYNLAINLTGIETSDYQKVFLVWKIDKWRGRPLFTFVNGTAFTNSQAHVYATADLGRNLQIGVSTNIEECVAAPWAQKNWMDCVTFFPDRYNYYKDWIVSRPTVWGVIQNREIRPDRIRPNCTLARVGEPVNTINGNMDLRATDISIPSRGAPLEFSRSYNSASDYSGPLGHRWTHNWNLFLTNSITVFRGVTNSWKVLQTAEGSHYSFRRLPDGSYEAPFDVDWALAETKGLYRIAIPGAMTYEFNSNGVLVAASDLWSNTVTLAYSNAAMAFSLTNVHDSAGRSLELSYSNSLLTRIQVPGSSLVVDYAYDSQLGDLVNATRHFGTETQVTIYSYDPFGGHCLTNKINPAGEVFSWDYMRDQNGRHTPKANRSWVGSDYFDTELAFDTNGLHKTTVTYALENTNRVFEYRYDSVLQRIQEIRSGNLTSSNWATVGRGSKLLHDDYGNVTNEMAYDNLVEEWRQTIRLYDTRHHVTNESSGYCRTPINGWSYEWHPEYGVPTAFTDPEGHRTEMTYTNGLLTRLRVNTTPSPLDTVYAYTDEGLLSVVTNANGNWIRHEYDGFGNRTSTVPREGPTISMEWDALGYLHKVNLPGAALRTITYDADELGRIRNITWQDGSEEKFFYDPIGNLTNHVDIAGRATRYSWLPSRKLSSVTRTLEGATNQDLVWSYVFDQQFSTLKILDPMNRPVESYTLDDQDRPVVITNLEGQTMTFDYGLGDFVRSVTRYDGTTVSNVFDGDGRLSGVIYPDSIVAFGYLKNSLMISASNEQGVISNTYDGANRLTGSTSVAPSGNVTIGYFPAGQVSNVITVAGSVMYDLDGADRVNNMTALAGTFSYSYNPNNGLLSGILCTNNGLQAVYSYDSMDRITNIVWRDSSNRIMRCFGYGFNEAGLINSVSREDGSSAQYAFDSLDRLMGETQRDASNAIVLDEALSYDLAGNRTAKVRDGLFVGYVLGSGDRLASWNVPSTNVSVYNTVSGSANEAIGAGSPYGQLWVSNTVSAKPTVVGAVFTASNFPVGLGTQKIVVAISDMAGNTAYATSTFFSSVATNAQYGYSSAGCGTGIVYRGQQYAFSRELTWNGRYQLTGIDTNGVLSERTGYDALGRRAWTYDGNNTNFFVYRGDQVAAEVDGEGRLLKSYATAPGVDRWLMMTFHTGSVVKTYFYLTDHLGTVHAVADETGSVVESYKYDAWGRVLGVFDSTGSEIEDGISKIGNSILWQGREYSWATGLYYFRARWYDPVVGRWLSPDPIGISGGLNQYVAFANNPVNYIDPEGTWVVPAIILLWAGTEWAVAPDNDCPQDQYKADGIMNMFKTAGIMAGTQGLFSGAKWAWGRLFSKSPTTALSPYRVTTPGETFIRYESGNPAFTKITPSGVKPNTFAAPASDGIVPVAERVTTYNLPSPEILRPNTITLTPPPGTPIIGPRPVAGGTGNEVNFWMGY